MRMRMKQQVILTLGFALSIVTPAAVAEDEDGADRIEEIVVTAQRREQKVLDVPLAISVFDDDAIEELGISDLEDLTLLIPSTTFGFDNQVTIRGVGQQAWRDASAEVGVAVYQNGLFYNENYGIIESSMFDLERVEVLRGPQGTLYGRNSMGGAINFINKKPEQEFGGELLVELTDFNGRRVNGMVTGPLSDQISFRLTGGYVKRDGTAENVGSAPDAGRLDNYFMSPQVRIQTDRLDFNLRYAQFRADEGHFDQLFFTQPDTSEETWIGPMGVEAGFNTHYLYETPAPSAVLSGPARHTNQIGEVKRKAVDHNRRNDRSIERDVINVEASFTFGDNWTLTYFGGWSDSHTEYIHDSDFTSRVPSAGDPFIAADAPVAFRDSQAHVLFPKTIHSNELHLLGDLNDTTLLFGLYQFSEESPFELNTYEYATAGIVQGINGCFGVVPVTRECASAVNWVIDATVNSVAAFVNVDHQVNDQWNVSVGLRYSEDDKEQTLNEFMLPIVFTPEFGFVLEFVEDEAQRTYDDWMGHVTVEFHPDDDQMFHGRYARAFRAGGFNSFTFGESDRTYGGETMDSFELGYKGTLNDGRLTLAANMYRYDYSDYQQPLTYRKIIEGNPVTISNWINLDGSSITGLELEASILLADNLMLRGFYAWTDSKLGDLLAFNGSNPNQEWLFDEEEEALSPANPLQLGGNSFPSLAEQQFSAALTWNIPDTDMGDFEVVTHYSWVGDREGSIWGIDLDRMEAYGRWDIRVNWEPRDDRFEVTAFIDNVLDKHGVTENEARNWEEDFIREGQLTDGRIWGIETRFKF